MRVVITVDAEPYADVSSTFLCLPLVSLCRECLGELALRGGEGVDHVPGVFAKLRRDSRVCRDVASVVVDGRVGDGVGDDDLSGLCLELYGAHEVVSA